MDSIDDEAFKKWFAKNIKKLRLHLVPDAEVEEVCYLAYAAGFNRGCAITSKEYQTSRG